jgi:hypothetical protein
MLHFKNSAAIDIIIRQKYCADLSYFEQSLSTYNFL